jgi:4-aminobutyrate aminotransferase/(S)-3-amino-2-methylpropionate transaminase
MALTAKSMPYKSGFGPFASEIYRVSGSYPLRDGLTGAQAAAKAIHSIEKQIGAGNLAAVIIEPIQGEGGFVVPADGFLPAIVEWCRANNVVFIADEVQSGFARTGKMFASEHFGIEPDLVVSAKGIAGGLPLSAVTGRAEIMDAPHIGGLGGTYGGNPIACAAALAVIQDIEEDDMLGKAQAIEKIMFEKLGALKAKDSRIAEVRGKGAMIALEIVDGAGKPDAVFTGKLAGALKAKGIIVLTCGTDGNIVRFLPPLTMPLELLEATLKTIDVTMSTL